VDIALSGSSTSARSPFSLDIEDDVDGAGEVDSLESRGSDELKFAMIRSIPALHLELF